MFYFIKVRLTEKAMAEKENIKEEKKSYKRGGKNFVTGPDPRRNLAGRPVGAKSWKTIVTAILDKIVEIEDLEGLFQQMTVKEALAMRLVCFALREDDPNIVMKAINNILESTDPKTNSLDLTSGGAPIQSEFMLLPLNARLDIIKILEEQEEQPEQPENEGENTFAT